MSYEYSGHLRHVLTEPPDPAALDALPCVEFTAGDFMLWSLSDDPAEPVWRHIPVNRTRTEDGVKLDGHFRDVRGIECLGSEDAPGFWVALSTRKWEDDRLPVDTQAYPIAEIAYRCTSGHAHPAWMWSYPGGSHLDGLLPTTEWHTVARRVSHFGFPPRVDGFTFRLYSTFRGTESFEIKSVRLRAMTVRERAACEKSQLEFEKLGKPKQYPILDEFLPIGCHMDAGTAKRLAAMLGVSLHDYWDLVFEDFVRHHHNCVALQKTERLTTQEWRDVLALAEEREIKFVVIHDVLPGAGHEASQDFIDTHVAPFAESPSVLAWSFGGDAPERAFAGLMAIRGQAEKADPRHPTAVFMERPNAFALYAPFFAACGMGHYRSHVPWEMGDLVGVHQPLVGGQQFWATGPAFIDATDTPEWHTCPEMRLMTNLAFARGARGWFTNSYHNDPVWVRGSCRRSLTGPFLTFGDLWSELGNRMKGFRALSPMLLQCHPTDSPYEWFVPETTAHTKSRLPDGVPPGDCYWLAGRDFQVCFIASNDVGEMTTVNIELPPGAAEGLEIHDLSDFMRTMQWDRIHHSRHVEMFPGQMHMILFAKPDACRFWRDTIAHRLIEDRRRQLHLDANLLHAYGFSTVHIEEIMASLGDGDALDDLETMQRAEETLLDLTYNSPAICGTRGKIIEASAAVCGCDGTLCRLQKRGKVDKARQLGFKVIPLAREFTNMRLALRRGEGAAINEQCEDLAKRALELLAEIRAVS